MTRRLLAALALAALGAGAAAHADPVIVDGSFESPNDDAPGIYKGGGDGWTTSFHGAVSIIRGNITDDAGRSYGATPFGDQYLGLDPRTRGFLSSDSQTVSGFVAGQAYALTLYVADSDGGSAPQLEILLSNDSDVTYLDRKVDVAVGGPYGNTISFQKVVTTFTASVSGDITLSLINSGNVYASPNADPGSISIDNVSIAAVSAVPEPASVATMLLGLGALGLRARSSARRRTRG